MKRHFVLSAIVVTDNMNKINLMKEIGGYKVCSLHLDVELNKKNVLSMKGHYQFGDGKTMYALEGETIDLPEFKKWAECSKRIKAFYLLREKYGKTPITDAFDLVAVNTLMEL